MIHHPDGKQESQLYDPAGGQCINSVSRPLLNLHLVQSLPEEIPIRFDTKLARVDFKTNTAYPITSGKGKSKSPSGSGDAENLKPGEEGSQAIAADPSQKAKVAESTRGPTGEDEDGTQFDVIIGCDGSWSKVRNEMMRVER